MIIQISKVWDQQTKKQQTIELTAAAKLGNNYSWVSHSPCQRIRIKIMKL